MIKYSIISLDKGEREGGPPGDVFGPQTESPAQLQDLSDAEKMIKYFIISLDKGGREGEGERKGLREDRRE